MKAKKPLIMAGVGAVVGLAAFAGVASAQTPTTTGTGPDDNQQSLVDKIAAKFNLNKSDVQAVVDQDKSEHQAAMQAKMDERLTQAVTDGKITEAQKTAIQDKQKELKTYLDSIKDKSDSERRDLMKAKMDELQQWAKDNGLTDYFRPMMGGHGGPHGGANFKVDMEAPATSTNQ